MQKMYQKIPIPKRIEVILWAYGVLVGGRPIVYNPETKTWDFWHENSFYYKLTTARAEEFVEKFDLNANVGFSTQEILEFIEVDRAVQPVRVGPYGVWKDWVDRCDFEYLSGGDYLSPRASSLYKALDSKLCDDEMRLGFDHLGQKWLLIGLTIDSHPIAFEC